jgi:hypothetical protein
MGIADVARIAGLSVAGFGGGWATYWYARRARAPEFPEVDPEVYEALQPYFTVDLSNVSLDAREGACWTNGMVPIDGLVLYNTARIPWKTDVVFPTYLVMAHELTHIVQWQEYGLLRMYYKVVSQLHRPWHLRDYEREAILVAGTVGMDLHRKGMPVGKSTVSGEEEYFQQMQLELGGM